MSRFASVKLERLQYKKILTPSWRKVNISPLLKREDDELETELLEEFDDADVLQRHQLLENSEKLQWCRWDQEGAQGWRSEFSWNGNFNNDEFSSSFLLFRSTLQENLFFIREKVDHSLLPVCIFTCPINIYLRFPTRSSRRHREFQKTNTQFEMDHPASRFPKGFTSLHMFGWFFSHLILAPNNLSCIQYVLHFLKK
ncbi:hypothetical protein DNTS_009740 [Danionella cerebrum]|uniref:PEHE domain-containing protein n=1 Tax=Danionella cerebrum TaxID=2873325 RepID=A0A553RNI4_9TELE|nr:hypothetical protein DNTS_009740 [Danionella translucida]